jgi:hypothetical protein
MNKSRKDSLLFSGRPAGALGTCTAQGCSFWATARGLFHIPEIPAKPVLWVLPKSRIFRRPIRLFGSTLRTGLGFETISKSGRSHRRAFMAIDTLFGIIIVGGITMSLIATVRHEQSAERALADSRSALHLAEHALINLQHGQPLPATTIDEHLTIHPANNGTAPAGFIWAKVDAAVNGHRQSLLGVVPIAAVPSGVKS